MIIQKLSLILFIYFHFLGELDFGVCLDTEAKANQGGIWLKATGIAIRVHFVQWTAQRLERKVCTQPARRNVGDKKSEVVCSVNIFLYCICYWFNYSSLFTTAGELSLGTMLCSRTSKKNWREPYKSYFNRRKVS